LEKVSKAHKDLTASDESMMDLYQKGLVDGFTKTLLAYGDKLVVGTCLK
jgi:hypothetical protein